jgi:tetratricopeptide (TPR) repeat protein
MESAPRQGNWLGLVLSNLSLIYQERGQYELALPLLQRAVNVSRQGSEEASEPLAWGLTNLANVYRILGDHKSALIAAEQAYKQFAATLGESNHQIVNAAVHVAAAKAMLGDPAGAEAFLRTAMAAQAELPPEHIERGLTQHFLGLVLFRQGRLKEAMTATALALQIRRKAFAAPNWRIAESAGQLGEIFATMGNLAAARPLLDESRMTFAGLHGVNSVRAREAAGRLHHWFPEQ